MIHSLDRHIPSLQGQCASVHIDCSHELDVQ
jgi:hypothetical protein